jgi:hypothetical protein
MPLHQGTYHNEKKSMLAKRSIWNDLSAVKEWTVTVGTRSVFGDFSTW